MNGKEGKEKVGEFSKAPRLPYWVILFINKIESSRLIRSPLNRKAIESITDRYKKPIRKLVDLGSSKVISK